MNLHPILLWLVMLIMSIDINKAIFNGSIVKGNTFNYQVSLWENCGYICSGAIIDTWHILTAAHCVFDRIVEKYVVSAGAKCLWDNCGSLHSVRKIHISEDHEILEQIVETGNTTITITYEKGDIAVLTLSTPLSFGINIEAIELPLRDVSYTGKRSVCKAAGWGCTGCGVLELSQHLLWTDAQLVELEKCASYVPVTADMICTLHPSQATTLLQGDSGTGLVCDDILVGIATASKADPHLPVRYMNVYYYLPFINDVRRKDCALYNFTAPVTEPERNHVPCMCL